MANDDDNRLLASGLPIFFDAGPAAGLGLALPANRRGQSVRVWARSLSVMQKEAVVASAATGRAWRLASDEGPYLEGLDAAPCPLSFVTTGMAASTMNEIRALAAGRGIRIDDPALVQDNYYTMEGSALAGTMTGGALPIELEARLGSDAGDAELESLVRDALRASPVSGLVEPAHESLFSLTVNGVPLAPGRVAPIEPLAATAVEDAFASLSPAAKRKRQDILVARTEAAETVHGVAGGAGSSLKATQRRKLHLRGTCRVLADGSKEVVQELFAPIGSTWRFLSDEAPGAGGLGAAPDAMSYVAAGIAFCFMTQLGRYAKIRRKRLDGYAVVQDIHFSPAGGAGAADPVETHVYLETPEGDDFARDLVDMGEQTCFLHALCRTPLDTRVRITRR